MSGSAQEMERPSTAVTERAKSVGLAWLKAGIAHGWVAESGDLEAIANLHQMARDVEAIAHHSVWESALRQGDVIRLKRSGPRAAWQTPRPVDTELTRTERTLDDVARLLKARRRYLEGFPVDVAAVRQERVLSEVETSAIEVALIYGYEDCDEVRQLRRRHGRCPETGHYEPREPPLTSCELPGDYEPDLAAYEAALSLGASIGLGTSTTVDEYRQHGTSIGKAEHTSEMQSMTYEQRTAGAKWLAANDPRHTLAVLERRLEAVLSNAGVGLREVREDAFLAGKPSGERKALRLKVREALEPIYEAAYAPKRDLMAEALGTTRQALGRLMRDEAA